MFYDHLLDNFDPITYLESHGYRCDHIRNKTEYLTDCPYCGKEKHLGVTPSKKVFGCYRCGEGGNYIKLIQKISKISFWEALKFLKEGSNLNHYNLSFIGDIIEDMQPLINLEEKIKPIKLPPEYIPLGNNRLPYLDTGRKFPIPQKLVKHHHMGYANEGPYKDRLFICDVNDEGLPIYWVARDMTGKVDKKWKVLNPSQEYTNIGSADLLFNFSLAKQYKTCIITEGVFDALYVGDNAVAAWGKGLKRNHLYWLLKANFQKVVLLFDSDVQDTELEKDAEVLSQFFNTYICKLPSGDPDEYEKKQLYSFLGNSKLYKKCKLDTLQI
jgi:DNA primase